MPIPLFVAEMVHTDGWTVFDKTPGALVLLDDDLRVVRANAAFAALAGREPHALVGESAFAFLPEAERPAAEGRLLARRSDDGPYSVDERFERPDGREGWLRVNVSTLEDGDPRLQLAQIEDTTDHRRTTARLERLAERDHLTGLLNRRRMEEELEKALAAARRHGRRSALVLIDLDHFKAVNDREGHEEGDRVLSFVAAILATRVRGEDAVGRLGGDEFALILADTTVEDAEMVAAELAALIAEAGYTRERGVTMSAGVAALSPELRTAQTALHAADLAMYAAKAAGRGRVVVESNIPSGGRREGSTPAAREIAEPRPRPGHVGELLGGLQSVADEPGLDHALRAVRDLLGMEVSYITHHTDTEQVFVRTQGAIETFGVGIGTRTPLEETYCHHILRGELPAAMADVRAITNAAAMPVTETAGVGAYASVPVRLSDGSLYGTLCAANHEPVPRLSDRDVQFLTVLARVVAGEVERDAALRTELALRAQAAGAEALLSAIEARDRVTGSHSRHVVDLATAVAAELGLPEHERAEVAQVALLHDIGKLALPDAILTKPGPLTFEEIVVMRRHPADGEHIVASIPELVHLAPAIRAAHERWDGGGYPDRLAGAQIPIASRIVFACDAWDAMTSDRPYRARMPRDEALAELASGAGSQFCANCVQALFAVLSRS